MERTVKIIEPKKKTLTIDSDKPLKVCAYCRVSTDEADQRNSLVTQKRFFERVFRDRPMWTNVGIFADEGISGTSLEKRDEFNRMIALAKRKAIDVIITKEVSRFSRNVKDLLVIVEDLRNIGVYVWFLSDNIVTDDINYRERLTQLATNAEAESLKTSMRVRWGHQRQMEDGVVFGRKEMFGYNIVRDEDGKQRFEIIEEEANIVRLVFKWFSAGDGTYTIARKLQEMGIKTKRYKNGWSNTVILRLLRNEKYVGDLAQGKTYTPDPLNHKKKYNFGESHMFYIENHHPNEAIIDRDTWNKVQAILAEKTPSEEVKAKHSNRYWISGKMYCGICGRRFVSCNKKKKEGVHKSWKCFETHQRGTYKQVSFQDGEVAYVGCNNRMRVNDIVLKTAVHDIITQIVIPNKDAICKEISEELKALNVPKDATKRVKAIERKIAKKNEDIVAVTLKHAQGIIPENAYLLTMQAVEKEIGELQKELLEIQRCQEVVSTEQEYVQYMEQLEQIVSLADDEINEGLYERITKKIIAYAPNLLEIHLSFLSRPIYLQYRTKGKSEYYTVEFDILNQELFTKALESAPKNEISEVK